MQQIVQPEGDLQIDIALQNAGTGCGAPILPAVTGEGYLAFDSDAVAWRVSLDETGIYRFAQDGLTLGVEKIGSYVNLKTNAGDPGFLVTSFTPGGQL